MRNHFRIALFLAFGGVLIAGCLAFRSPAKRLEGKLHLKQGLFDQVKGATPCRLDSAGGYVIEIRDETINPQFASSRKNQVRLLIWLPEEPTPNTRIEIPSGINGLCYREEGNLLMFETFQGQGWIEFGAWKKRKQLDGKLDLKLIHPHHNFSNSDYHFLGGSYRLSVIGM